jgi:hypothetical protein
MSTINITKQSAIKAWSEADNIGKKLLENLLGEDAVKPKDMRERINTWEDVLSITGASSVEYLPRHLETDDEFAYRQAKLIAFAYNGNKVASLDEYRYYPWANLVKDSSKPSGFALSYDGCVIWTSYSFVGVRLCFSNSDHAKDAFKKFTPIYERLQIF